MIEKQAAAPQEILPPFAVTTKTLVQQLMTLPADLIVLNAASLMFLTPPEKAPAISDVIVPDAGIILPN